MNKARIFIVLAIALAIGGVLSYSVYNFLQSQQVQVAYRPPDKQIVVAKTQLPIGAPIKPENLGTLPWPGSDNPPVGYFEKTEDVVGRAVLQPMVENEPILEAKLAPKEGGAGLPPIIPQGMRALTIRANEIIGVAGYVLPRTRVDVVLTATPRGAEEPVTKIVLQNVEVVSSAQTIQKDPEGKPQTVTHVTLLVTPEDAEKLTSASSQGQFQLALRNPLDLEKADTKGVQVTQLFHGTARVAPGPVARAPRRTPQVIAAPPPPARTSVEVIKGTQRSNVEF